MLIDQKTAGGRQQNDEDYNSPTGVYLCKFTDVQEMAAKQDDESKTPRLVFEWVVAEGQYAGKKLATFVRKNLFAGNARGAQPSHLFKLAKSLGVADPMAGFDTNQFIGRYYTIVAKNEKGDRAWPDSIIPAGQSAPAPAAPPAAGPPPHPGFPPAEPKFWYTDPSAPAGTPPALKTAAELEDLCKAGLDPRKTYVCKEGASAWGFLADELPATANVIPF